MKIREIKENKRIMITLLWKTVFSWWIWFIYGKSYKEKQTRLDRTLLSGRFFSEKEILHECGRYCMETPQKL